MIDCFHSSGVLPSLNAALQIWCISLTTGSPPYFIISPTTPSLPGLLLFFKCCTVLLTSSSSISMSASSLGGGIVTIQYNKNQVYNAHKVTPKCESEARIFSHQVNSN